LLGTNQPQNELRVLAAQPRSPSVTVADLVLFPAPDFLGGGGRSGGVGNFHAEFLARAAALVKLNDRDAALAAAAAAAAGGAAGPMAAALEQHQRAKGTGGVAAALSRALCFVHKARSHANGGGGAGAATAGRVPARMLVLQATDDDDDLCVLRLLRVCGSTCVARLCTLCL